MGCSSPCSRITTRSILALRSRAAEAPLCHPRRQFRSLSTTVRCPSRRALHHCAIHSREMLHPLGVVRLGVVVRTWRRIEEVAESSFGRGKRLRSACNLPARLVSRRSRSTDVYAVPFNISFISSCKFLFFPSLHSSFLVRFPIACTSDRPQYASYNNPSLRFTISHCGPFFSRPKLLPKECRTPFALHLCMV